MSITKKTKKSPEEIEREREEFQKKWELEHYGPYPIDKEDCPNCSRIKYNSEKVCGNFEACVPNAKYMAIIDLGGIASDMTKYLRAQTLEDAYKETREIWKRRYQGSCPTLKVLIVEIVARPKFNIWLHE